MRVLSFEEARVSVSQYISAHRDVMKDPEFRREAVATQPGVQELPDALELLARISLAHIPQQRTEPQENLDKFVFGGKTNAEAQGL